MKMTILALCAVVTTAGFAIQQTPEQIARSRAKRAAALAAKGGLVTKPQSGNLFRVVSVQDRIDQSRIHDLADDLNTKLLFGMEVSSTNIIGSPIEFAQKFVRTRKTGSLLLVVDDAVLPVILAAPEDAWAILNVHTLDSDLPPANIYDERVRKEFNRAAASAFNAGQSLNKPCVMDPVYSKSDLDGLKMNSVGPESVSKIIDTAKKRGINPVVVANYRTACTEGWAPAPTNDVQKAIWDDVHAIPTEPIKIKP